MQTKYRLYDAGVIISDVEKLIMNKIPKLLSKKNSNHKNDLHLKKINKNYQSLICSSPDSIVITDIYGIITSISDMCLNIFGVDDRSELIGIPFCNVVHSCDIKIYNNIFEIALNDGLIQNKEICLKKKDKVIFPAEVSVGLIQSNNGMPVAYVIIIRDIRIRKKNENKIFHNKRLVSLGRMASDMAHEIYQPINNIGLCVDRILMDINEDVADMKGDIKIRAEKILENILRVQNIIDNIMLFSNNENNYIASIVDINKSIKNVLLVFSDNLKNKSICIKYISKSEDVFVSGNMYKFEQVIQNVIKNAIDALEEKKQINKSLFKLEVIIRVAMEMDDVIISINDNGVGISKDSIDVIMQPFYSTKESSKGTGLGLSICYGIIKEMNGTITIDSLLMEGTTLTIKIPRAKKYV